MVLIKNNIMNTQEFKDWKKWYKSQYPEEFSIFDDKFLYELFLMNEK